MAGELDPKTAKLKEMGTQIRQQRERLGMTLEEVRDETKIRVRYLAAVEEGDDSVAPAPAYFRAFLKTYAMFLGLDGLAFSRAYGELNEATLAKGVPGPEEQKKRRRSRNRRKQRRISPFFLVILLLAAVLAYPVWGRFFRDKNQAQIPPEEVNAPDGNKVTPEEPVDPGEKTSIVFRKDPSKETTVWETGLQPLKLLVTVRSGEDDSCWMRVESDGKKVFEGTAGPGENLSFDADREITIRAGKPWVLTLSLNENDLGPGGPYGPVKDLIVRYVPRNP